MKINAMKLKIKVIQQITPTTTLKLNFAKRELPNER